MGSPTPQNNNPIPIPAEISIAYQETVENSGRACGPPKRIFPYLLKARYRADRTKTLKTSMYIHPNWLLIKLRTTAEGR